MHIETFYQEFGAQQTETVRHLLVKPRNPNSFEVDAALVCISQVEKLDMIFQMFNLSMILLSGEIIVNIYSIHIYCLIFQAEPSIGKGHLR